MIRNAESRWVIENIDLVGGLELGVVIKRNGFVGVVVPFCYVGNLGGQAGVC